MNKIYFQNSEVDELNSIFVKNGFQLYLVGGCVRDLLQNKEPHDIDLCTNAFPSELKEIFMASTNYKIIDHSEKFGTLVFYSIRTQNSYEITTFRSEGRYVDYRHPSEVHFSRDINTDLCRRDFTMNAIAYELHSNTLIDPFHGIDDLSNRKLRCVGNPLERFTEDPLRIIRMFRFAVNQGLQIELNTYHDAILTLPLIDNLSKERIQQELIKLFSFKNKNQDFSICSPLFERLIATLNNQCQTRQNSLYQDETTDWSLPLQSLNNTNQFVEDYSEIECCLIRFAFLFHEIGKLCYLSLNETLSISIAKDFLNHNKFSQKMTKSILYLIKTSELNFLEMKKSKIRKIILENPDTSKLIIVLKQCIYSTQEINQFENAEEIELKTRIKVTLQFLEDKEHQNKKGFLINGQYLKELGFTPSPLFSVILEDVNNALVDEELENDKDSITHYIFSRYQK